MCGLHLHVPRRVIGRQACSSSSPAAEYFAQGRSMQCVDVRLNLTWGSLVYDSPEAALRRSAKNALGAESYWQ